MMTIQSYNSFTPFPVLYLGPPLEKGPMPSVFYFSVCALETLSLDPFNQPALILASQGFRVFSITLPGHGPGYDKLTAMQYWSEHLSELKQFIENLHKLIDHFLEHSLITPKQFAVMGLSRGGFVATHLLTHEHVPLALGFAPVTDLEALSEFQNLKDNTLFKELSLNLHLEKLYKKKLRYYIGNRDIRVSTQASFNLVTNLANYAYNQRVRSPTIELFITPSTGQFGHGTLPHTFEEGCLWLKKQIVK